MPKLIVIPFFFCLTWLSAQSVPTRLITPLDSSFLEISGLTHLNGVFIGHNDSGNDPVLMEIDTSTGAVNRTVYIKNAPNIDWEDLTHDNTHIYIGDFGNNAGSRLDLNVYRLSIADFFNTPTDSVSVDTISFSYADQIDFSPPFYTTNYDCEAMTVAGDSLLLATKNWGNSQSRLYKLSKTPGNYSISPFQTINPQGLVSGMYHDTTLNNYWLCGYNLSESFLIRMDQNFNTERVTADFNGNIKIESICHITSDLLMVSTESKGTDISTLFAVSDFYLSQDVIKEASMTITIHQHNLTINANSDPVLVNIFTIKGDLVKTLQENNVSLQNMSSGIYVVQVNNLRTGRRISKKINL